VRRMVLTGINTRFLERAIVFAAIPASEGVVGRYISSLITSPHNMYKSHRIIQASPDQP
jgi:hypothetical protein